MMPRREDDEEDEGILTEEDKEDRVEEKQEEPESIGSGSVVGSGILKPRTDDEIIADTTTPLAIKFLKYAKKYNNLTIAQVADIMKARGFKTGGIPYQSLDMLAKRKARLELAGDTNLERIGDFYDGLITAEDVKKLEPFLVEMEAKAKKQAREQRTQKKDGDYGMMPNNYSPPPYSYAYDQQQSRSYGTYQPPPPTNNGPETPKQAALRAILERMPRLNDRDKYDILQLYSLNSQVYENDSSRLFEFLTNALGGPRGQFIWKQLNMLTGSQAQESAESPLFSNQGGVFGSAGADPTAFNSGMMPPMGMPGMGGMGMSGAPPQMQQMFYLMQMQQMMESMQDTKQEKMIKQMVQAAMMSVLSRSLEHKSGGGEDLMSMLPLLAGGGVGVEEGIDAQGKPVKRLIPVKKEDNANNPMMTMMANLNQQLIGGLIQNKLGNDNAKEYKDLFKEVMQMNKERNDPIELIAKLKNGLPEVFGSQHQSLEEVRLNIESQLMLMDKRFNFERLRWEREDKLHERAIQHENMKEYMHSLNDIGTNIFKPVIDKVADGVVSGMQNQQKANVAQQQARPQEVKDVDFSRMTDEELERYRVDRDNAVRMMNERMQVVNQKSAELDLEYQRRVAKRNSVPQQVIQPPQQTYANGSGLIFAARPTAPTTGTIPPMQPPRSFETGSLSSLDEDLQEDLDETLGIAEEDYIGAAGVNDLPEESEEDEEDEGEEEEEDDTANNKPSKV